jgi:hypothetical protein
MGGRSSNPFPKRCSNKRKSLAHVRFRLTSVLKSRDHPGGSMRRFLIVATMVALICCYAFAGGGRHGSSHSSSTKSSKSSKDSSGKTQHVKGYYRKDGTYVQGYDRHPAGTAPHEATAASASHSSITAASRASYKRNYLAPGYVFDPTVKRDKHGKIKRSSAAKNAFKREHPCPVTGKSSGRCPGYVVDHVNALECGGADAPSNMQWQTAADAKTKDRTEHYCR